MARPQKKGIDYFSLDVNFDSSLEVILSKYGEKGLGISVRIWQHIYKTYGYFLPYSDDELYMIKRNCNDTSLSEIKSVIESMVEKSLFNKELFNEGILTSKRLQANYKTATRKRVSVGSNPPYWLLDGGSNTEFSTQSKLNNTKVNNIKVNTNYSLVVKTWNDLGLNKVLKITDKRKKHINARVLDYGFDKLIGGIKSIKDSKFLMESKDTNWLSFDWVLNPNNFIKLVEGKYHKEFTNYNTIGKNLLPTDIESDWLDDYIKSTKVS